MTTNEETRINVIESLRAFVDNHCHYSYEELVVATDALNVIGEPEKDKEDYNARHPKHGERNY